MRNLTLTYSLSRNYGYLTYNYELKRTTSSNTPNDLHFAMQAMSSWRFPNKGKDLVFFSENEVTNSLLIGSSVVIQNKVKRKLCLQLSLSQYKFLTHGSRWHIHTHLTPTLSLYTGSCFTPTARLYRSRTVVTRAVSRSWWVFIPPCRKRMSNCWDSYGSHVTHDLLNTKWILWGCKFTQVHQHPPS